MYVYYINKNKYFLKCKLFSENILKIHLFSIILNVQKQVKRYAIIQFLTTFLQIIESQFLKKTNELKLQR